MQRVVNCVICKGNQVLMLQKPKRGWWVAPGGKMEPTESVVEAVKREVREETGLIIYQPRLCGVFSIVLQENRQTVDEWMMFTFFADKMTGQMLTACEEGSLLWHDIAGISALETAPGDQYFLEPIAAEQAFLTGRFVYTPQFELLDASIDT